jgi:hypothetical protein
LEKHFSVYFLNLRFRELFRELLKLLLAALVTTMVATAGKTLTRPTSQPCNACETWSEGGVPRDSESHTSAHAVGKDQAVGPPGGDTCARKSGVMGRATGIRPSQVCYSFLFYFYFPFSNSQIQDSNSNLKSV